MLVDLVRYVVTIKERLVMKKAPFVVIEGIDGCGKTSAVKAIAKRYPNIHVTREPGGTLLAERIRSFLLSEKGAILSPEEQMTMFFAARQIHLAEVIEVKRGAGIPVVTDRFDGSTFAFQKCLNIENGLVVGDSKLFDEFFLLRDHVVVPYAPTLYIYMNVDPEEGMRRRALDRDQDMNHFDLASIKEQQRRSASYERFFSVVCHSGGSRVVTIDANLHKHQVIQLVLATIHDELARD